MSKPLKSLLITAFALFFIACGEGDSKKSENNQHAMQHSQHSMMDHENHDHAAHAAAGHPGADHSMHGGSIDVSKIDTSAKYEDGKKILRVFGVNPRLTVLLELLYPQGIIGLNYKPYPEDLEFMPKGAENLPVLGLHGGVSFERLVALKPDLIIFMENTDLALIEPYEKMGIKTLQVSADFNKIEQTLPVLGKVLGVEERAAKLLEFHKKQEALLKDLRAKMQKKPRIYFAYALEGLTTECVKAGQTNDLATMIGAENVIKCEKILATKDNAPLNHERLISLDPEVIFVREIGLYKELMTKPSTQWARVSAVKNKRIIYAPSSPSNWLTRPPTVMRIIGYPWAFAKLHPDLLSENEARQIAQEFFAEFLQPLSDETYERLEARE